MLLGSSYNTPFINTDETIKLSYGMSKTEVENEFGQPLYVQSGIKDLKKIIWVYEVRTIEIQSKKTEYGVYTPTKSKYYLSTRASGNIQKHSSPIHRIQIEFIDNKVTSWGPIENKKTPKKEVKEAVDDKSLDSDTAITEKSTNFKILAPKKKKRRSKERYFFFDPKFIIRQDSWNMDYRTEYYHNNEWYSDTGYLNERTTGGSVGFNSGMKFKHSRVGLDIRAGSGIGIMLALELNIISSWNFLIAVGYDEELYYNVDEEMYFGEEFKSGVLKFEISRDLGKLNLGIGTIPNIKDSGDMMYFSIKYRVFG